jgi:hypothetical protein
MVSPDFALRRRVVALLAVSVKDRTFRPELITGLSELFEVERSVIYSDLRSLEPQVGCLLEKSKTRSSPRHASEKNIFRGHAHGA